MKKLFVGGLSWNTDDGQLKDAFEKFGTVTSAKVITDRETERSRGFGFVEFDNSDDAAKAREQMDGAELDGRTLKVDTAKERERGGGGGNQRRGGRHGGRDRY
jgi:RNA recognition motif-containing protein